MLSFLLIASYAETISGKCGENVNYYFDKDNSNLTISGSGSMTDYEYTSPAPWKQYSNCIKYAAIDEGVTTVGACAFYECKDIISITIPESIKSIETNAFCGCEILTSITIPESVTTIGTYAFCYCCELKSVVIPDHVSFIGENAFNGCSGLSYVNIPKGISSIGNSLFYGCINLRSITIPESVTSIGELALGNTGLTSIDIHEYVTYISSRAFDFCKSMTSINVSPNNKAYKSREGVLFNYTEKELLCCPAGKRNSYIIPSGVEKIEAYAFSRCIYRSSIIIPTSVIEICSNAFEHCDGLSSIIIPQLRNALENTFDSCHNLSSVTYLGTANVEDYNSVFFCV